MINRRMFVGTTVAMIPTLRLPRDVRGNWWRQCRSRRPYPPQIGHCQPQVATLRPPPLFKGFLGDYQAGSGPRGVTLITIRTDWTFWNNIDELGQLQVLFVNKGDEKTAASSTQVTQIPFHVNTYNGNNGVDGVVCGWLGNIGPGGAGLYTFVLLQNTPNTGSSPPRGTVLRMEDGTVITYNDAGSVDFLNFDNSHVVTLRFVDIQNPDYYGMQLHWE